MYNFNDNLSHTHVHIVALTLCGFFNVPSGLNFRGVRVQECERDLVACRGGGANKIMHQYNLYYTYLVLL